MFGRFMFMAMIPLWIWATVIGTVCLMIAGLLMTVTTLGGTAAQIGQDWHYQCDSAIGPDPAVTETTVSTTESVTVPQTGNASVPSAGYQAAAGGVPSVVPTTNPYAGVTFAPSDNASVWDQACATALRYAPYQQQPVATAAAGTATQCARKLALASVGHTAPSGIAELAATVEYRASLAPATGQCGESEAATSTSVRADMGVPLDSTASTCGSTPGSSAATRLPNTIAGQALCGQRITASAVSAGDLVFWGYQGNAATGEGIALDGATVVAVDAVSGRVIEQAVPTDAGVRFKRVLGS